MTTTTAPISTTPSPLTQDHAVNYEIKIPYTDPLWTVCEAADGANLPTEPPLSSCDCVNANITLANNDTTLSCNCSFALMEKCSNYEYSFQIPNIKHHEDDGDIESELTANCNCDLFVMKTMVPIEEEETDNHHHQDNSSSSTEHSGTSTTAHPDLTNTTMHGSKNNTNHTSKPSFTITRSLKGNCTCIVPALNKPDIETEWWNQNWTFPDNWNYTLNNTFPKMDYSFEKEVDMETIINDGRSVMKYIYGSTFSSKFCLHF